MATTDDEDDGVDINDLTMGEVLDLYHEFVKRNGHTDQYFSVDLDDGTQEIYVLSLYVPDQAPPGGVH